MERETIQHVIDIAGSYSIDLTIYDEAFLAKSIRRRCSVAKIKSPYDFYVRLRESRAEAEAFFQSLHISYSSFFREPLLFDLLDQMVIPDLIRRTPVGKEIRIWSAGCSCGQEAYSLAMLLDDRVESSDKHLQYRIFATDVSETALANARKGIYSTTDVKNVRHHHMQAYFTEKNGEYAVSQRLKDKVGFSLYDMLDTSVAAPPESIFGCFDIVCCSNLMMYYKAEIRSFILRKIENAVSQSGFLVVGEADRAFVKKNSALRPITVPVSAFRKSAYTHLDETDESFFDNI